MRILPFFLYFNVFPYPNSSALQVPIPIPTLQQYRASSSSLPLLSWSASSPCVVHERVART